MFCSFRKSVLEIRFLFACKVFCYRAAGRKTASHFCWLVLVCCGRSAGRCCSVGLIGQAGEMGPKERGP
jgi:hypothetical protein